MNSKDYLGKTFKDRVTGFEGVATGVHHWLTGCSTVSIQPPIDKNGKVPESQGFDFTRLDQVEQPEVKVDTSKVRGGPQDCPAHPNTI